MTTYRITNWDKTYENNRSRELKEAAWFPCPNVFDGDGYCYMIDGKDGPAAYAGWILILAVASRCKPRGVLTQTTGQPHTAQTIATKVRVAVRVIEIAISRSLHTAWLEEVPHDGAVSSQASAAQVRSLPRERKGKEENTAPPPPSPCISPREGGDPDGGGAGGEVVRVTPRQAEMYRLIVDTPSWTVQNGVPGPWIDQVTARQLACLPTTTPALIAHAVKEARQKRNTLDNPAGLVVKRLRHPDPGLLEALAAQESQ